MATPSGSKVAELRRRCAYCSRPHPVSARVAEESPFCARCLPERVAARVGPRGDVVLVEDGDRVVLRSLPLETL